jgi:protein-disulfide isomerase
VTLVEFSDFECPFCSRAAAVVEKIREKYGDRVRFVFRQFPLPMHQNAHEAAEASLAAHAQGKFWQFHDVLFENQKQLDKASLEDHAKQVGLDVGTFKQALESDKYAAAVDADMKLGSQVSVQGTPTLFINGVRVADPTNFEGVSRLIEDALKG